MILGIDVDNVIVSTTEALIEYLNERIPNFNLKLEDIKEYKLEKNLPPEYSLIVQEAFESKHLWKKVGMMPNAAFYIKKLYDDGHDIYFVTSSLPENLRKKIKHLQRNLDFLPPRYIFEHTINIHKKQLLNLDILFDDCLDNLIGETSYYPVCMGYPWNRDSEIFHVNNWAEFYNFVCNYIEEKVKE